MRVSEITHSELIDYLRLDRESLNIHEIEELKTLIRVANAFIKSYTGLSENEIDKHEDFIIAVYILVQDMYDNRVLYVDKDNLNKVVDTILGMHSVNLL